MQIFESYFSEREGCEVVKTEHGFAAVVVSVSDKQERNLFCKHFFIHPEFRASGKGHELLNAVIDRAHELACLKVSCTVIPDHALNHATLMATLGGRFIFKGLNQYKHLYFEREI